MTVISWLKGNKVGVVGGEDGDRDRVGGVGLKFFYSSPKSSASTDLSASFPLRSVTALRERASERGSEASDGSA